MAPPLTQESFEEELDKLAVEGREPTAIAGTREQISIFLMMNGALGAPADVATIRRYRGLKLLRFAVWNEPHHVLDRRQYVATLDESAKHAGRRR